MSTYNRLIHSPYRREAAGVAFQNLIEHPKDPKCVEEAINVSFPVIGAVLRSHFRWLDKKSEAYEESVSSCVYRLYLLFLSDRFYTRFYINPESQFAYLYQVCKYEIISVISKLAREQQRGLPIPQALLNLDTSEAGIWYRIYLKEIPAEVYRNVKGRIRFTGKEGDLCDFIAVSLIEGRGIPVVLIRQKWGTTNLRFFTDYVRVLIRSVLVGMRKDIEAIPTVLEAEEAGAMEATAQELYGGELSFASDSLDSWYAD